MSMPDIELPLFYRCLIGTALTAITRDARRESRAGSLESRIDSRGQRFYSPFIKLAVCRSFVGNKRSRNHVGTSMPLSRCDTVGLALPE